MIHQPSGGAGGQASDFAIAAKEILRWRKTLNETIALHTGKTADQIEKDSDRDYYMSAEEAKAYGDRGPRRPVHPRGAKIPGGAKRRLTGALGKLQVILRPRLTGAAPAPRFSHGQVLTHDAVFLLAANRRRK